MGVLAFFTELSDNVTNPGYPYDPANPRPMSDYFGFGLCDTAHSELARTATADRRRRGSDAEASDAPPATAASAVAATSSSASHRLWCEASLTDALRLCFAPAVAVCAGLGPQEWVAVKQAFRRINANSSILPHTNITWTIFDDQFLQQRGFFGALEAIRDHGAQVRSPGAIAALLAAVHSACRRAHVAVVGCADCVRRSS